MAASRLRAWRRGGIGVIASRGGSAYLGARLGGVCWRRGGESSRHQRSAASLSGGVIASARSARIMAHRGAHRRRSRSASAAAHRLARLASARRRGGMASLGASARRSSASSSLAARRSRGGAYRASWRGGENSMALVGGISGGGARGVSRASACHRRRRIAAGSWHRRGENIGVIIGAASRSRIIGAASSAASRRSRRRRAHRGWRGVIIGGGGGGISASSHRVNKLGGALGSAALSSASWLALSIA